MLFVLKVKRGINLYINKTLIYNWVSYGIVVLFLIGLFFRFTNLDQKIYWYDETITSLRVSGYRQSEVVQQVFNDREISIQELQKYQQINSEKSLLNTAYSLATEAPQHPPLYFFIARFWMQRLGQSVAIIRSLSAFISLLIFPCLYWLCLELFKTPMVGWVAIVLMAVSPFHVLYAQEAREYSLWTVTILLSSATLLRAIRLKSKLSWKMYALTVITGLYSFTFSIFIMLGHGIYVLANEKFKLTRVFRDYLFSCFLGFVAFSPWMLIIIIHLLAVGNIASWTAIDLSLPALIQQWMVNFSSIFLDLNFSYHPNTIYLTLPVLVLELYSIYFICKRSPQQIWLFVLTLVGVTALALVLPDLLWGGRRSSVSRYLIPCYLGIHLAVAFAIATQIISANSVRRQLWRIITVVLISGGIVSCVASSQAVAWWNKYDSYDNPQIARIINQAHRPLVISDPGVSFGYVLSLSYMLNPDVRLHLLTQSISEISTDATDIFLYRPSQELRNQLQKNYTILPIQDSHNFWRLES